MKMYWIKSRYDNTLSKTVAQDANIVVGITNPHFYHLGEFEKYDIRTLGDNYRYIETIINRDGISGECAHFRFVGQCAHFKPLPSPSNISAMNKVVMWLDALRNGKLAPPENEPTFNGKSGIACIGVEQTESKQVKWLRKLRKLFFLQSEDK